MSLPVLGVLLVAIVLLVWWGLTQLAWDWREPLSEHKRQAWGEQQQ